MLRSGMVVRTRDGRIVMLMGRNGCNLSIWWGHRLKPDGNRQCLKPDTTMPVLSATDVVSIQFGKEQGVFWEIFQDGRGENGQTTKRNSHKPD